MGVFALLFRQIAGRAQVRADLVNVGAHGTVHDLVDLVSLLPPRDAFGETASDAVVTILGRATADDLEAWRGLARTAPWRLPPSLAGCTDLGTLALAAFHPAESVRGDARRGLARLEHSLAARVLAS